MKLLNKTVTSYFIFSGILLLASIPVFYFALKTMVVNNVDEDLMATKIRIMPQLLAAATKHTGWNADYPGYEIVFTKELPVKIGDSTYDIEVTETYPQKISRGRVLASHFFVNKESYRLQIKTSIVDKLSFIKRIVSVLAILLIVLLVGLLIINRVLTKKIWGPFYNTLKGLQEYQLDRQPALKFKKSSVSEFNDLNEAIEQLTKKNYHAYISQKEFIENATHEMQSPLAVFQSILELLMQTKPLNEEQATLITDLANAGKRMGRLNKSLVLLTKIENNQFLDKETMSLKDILEKLLDQYGFQVQQKSIKCSFTVKKDITVEANKTLVEILLGNLLSNAIRHNTPGGHILIELKDHELIIQNSGKPISLDTQKVFQRFYKDSPDANSIGLGLEIIKKICNLYNYSLQYRFISQLHTFSVKF